MLKNFLLKQLVKSQLGKLPPEAQHMITDIMEKNPDLLLRMAQDFQAAKTGGQSDQSAFLAVASKYKQELQTLRDKA